VSDPLNDPAVRRKLAAVRHVDGVTGNMAMTCRYFGISRQHYYTWLRRYHAEGLDGLRDRSRQPKTCPHATDTEVVGCQAEGWGQGWTAYLAPTPHAARRSPPNHTVRLNQRPRSTPGPSPDIDRQDGDDLRAMGIVSPSVLVLTLAAVIELPAR
jgi:hypothetical protein